MDVESLQQRKQYIVFLNNINGPLLDSKKKNRSMLIIN